MPLSRWPERIAVLGIQPDASGIRTVATSRAAGRSRSTRLPPRSTVGAFFERPDAALAERLVRRGGLWNSSVMVFRVGHHARGDGAPDPGSARGDAPAGATARRAPRRVRRHAAVELRPRGVRAPRAVDDRPARRGRRLVGLADAAGDRTQTRGRAEKPLWWAERGSPGRLRTRLRFTAWGAPARSHPPGRLYKTSLAGLSLDRRPGLVGGMGRAKSIVRRHLGSLSRRTATRSLTLPVDGRPFFTLCLGGPRACTRRSSCSSMRSKTRALALGPCALAPDHRVYALDLPGFGRSDGPAGGLDACAALGDAASRPGSRRWGSPTRSWRAARTGCQVVAQLVARHPERVARVVLDGPTLAPQVRSAARRPSRVVAQLCSTVLAVRGGARGPQWWLWRCGGRDGLPTACSPRPHRGRAAAHCRADAGRPRRARRHRARSLGRAESRRGGCPPTAARGPERRARRLHAPPARVRRRRRHHFVRDVSHRRAAAVIASPRGSRARRPPEAATGRRSPVCLTGDTASSAADCRCSSARAAPDPRAPPCRRAGPSRSLAGVGPRVCCMSSIAQSTSRSARDADDLAGQSRHARASSLGSRPRGNRLTVMSRSVTIPTDALAVADRQRTPVHRLHHGGGVLEGVVGRPAAPFRRWRVITSLTFCAIRSPRRGTRPPSRAHRIRWSEPRANPRDGTALEEQDVPARADATAAASAPRSLRWVSDETPGIQRGRRGRGFVYRRPNGSLVGDPHTLARIRAIAIPAWERVWVCERARRPHPGIRLRRRAGVSSTAHHADRRRVRDEDK